MTTTTSPIAGSLFESEIGPDDYCAYCSHTLAKHDRTEPKGNQADGARCGDGCVCSGFCDATAVYARGDRGLDSDAPVRTYMKPENWRVVTEGYGRRVVALDFERAQGRA